MGLFDRYKKTDYSYMMGMREYLKNFMLDYIEVNAFGRQALYSTDGMTTALEFMYDEDTKIYFQVPGNLSEEEILEYAEDFVF